MIGQEGHTQLMFRVLIGQFDPPCFMFRIVIKLGRFSFMFKGMIGIFRFHT